LLGQLFQTCFSKFVWPLTMPIQLRVTLRGVTKTSWSSTSVESRQAAKDPPRYQSPFRRRNVLSRRVRSLARLITQNDVAWPEKWFTKSSSRWPTAHLGKELSGPGAVKSQCPQFRKRSIWPA